MASTPPDPGAFFRDMLGQWEKFTNTVGGEAMKSDEFARGLHGASAATMGAQTALKGLMERGLAAANMPSRAELEDLSARIARIEASLFRIEGTLNTLAGAGDPADAAPRPTRTRQPPPGDDAA